MQSVLCSEFNPVSIDPTELMETGVDGWRREEGSTSNPHRSDKRPIRPYYNSDKNHHFHTTIRTDKTVICVFTQSYLIRQMPPRTEEFIVLSYAVSGG